MKHCNVCGKDKNESEFGKRPASKDGLAAMCKQCQKEYDKARSQDSKRMKMRRDYQKKKKQKEGK